MKIYKEDGTFYYYYYKKKKGRHKKTGPKKIKDKKKRGSLNQQTWDFKILLFDFHKQVDYIGKYHNYGEADQFKQKILELNDKIEFPVKYINSKSKSKRLTNYISEYVILKRNFDKDEDNSNLLRNEYGRFIKNYTTDKNWIVYDKFKHEKEETFWVYGFNPRTNRKTFNYIYTNYIDNIINDTYNLIQIYIYNNKVIFRYDYDNIEFVICKNISDAIRMYNLLSEKYKKSKQVFFTGFTRNKKDRTNEIINLIKNKTGWDLKKIYKSSTDM